MASNSRQTQSGLGNRDSGTVHPMPSQALVPSLVAVFPSGD